MARPRTSPIETGNAGWALLEPFIPAPTPGGRPARIARRDIIDPVFYVMCGGVSWRMVPADFPYWKTGYDYFRPWKFSGLWERTNDVLRVQTQMKRLLFADGGDKGTWEAWVKTNIGHTVKIVQRPDANTREYWLPDGQELTPEQIATFRGHRGFVVIKKRWIVERSFVGTSFERCLNREYGLLPGTTEAFITLYFIRRMIRRLAAFDAQHAVAASFRPFRTASDTEHGSGASAVHPERPAMLGG